MNRAAIRFVSRLFVSAAVLVALFGCKSSAQRTSDHMEARKSEAERDAKDRHGNLNVVTPGGGGIVVDDTP